MRSRANSYAQTTTPNGGDNGGGERGQHPPRWGAAPPPPTTDGNTPRGTGDPGGRPPAPVFSLYWGWRPPPRGILRPPLTPWTGWGARRWSSSRRTRWPSAPTRSARPWGREA